MREASLASIYFATCPEALATVALDADAKAALKAHWNGDFAGAIAAYDRLEVARVQPPETRALLKADRLLLGVKIGMGPGSLADDPELSRHVHARFITHYALLSYYFWVDHNKAWRSIRRMFLLAPFMPARGIFFTVIFLTGHFWAIAGKTQRGYCLASFAHGVARGRERAGRPLAVFAKRAIFSCFPYTLLLTGRLSRLHTVIDDLGPIVRRDPFYAAIFLVSTLYAYAYSGDVARTDVAADQFARLHAEGKLLRYQPISRIITLLPMVLRGYGALVRDRFHALISTHKEEASDPLINSQFFRIAALIALFVDERERAAALVRRAVHHREASRSFQAWASFDATIERLALSAEPVAVADLSFLDIEASRRSAATLGNLGFELMALLPTASTKDDLWLAREGIRIVSRGLNLGEPRIQTDDEAALTPEDEPKLRSGRLVATFPAVAAARRETLKTVFLEVSSALKITAGIAQRMKTMQEEIDRSTRAITVAKTTQMLAHDVRKPFSLVKMGLTRLAAAEGEIELREVAARLADEAGRALEGANRMIQDMLASGRPAVTSRRDVALASIVARSAEEALAARAASRVELSIEVDGSLSVRIDPLEIQRVFSNVLENALDAMGAGPGRIWVRARVTEARDAVAITIGNDGPAIPETALPRLFEPYFTTGKPEGTGLGLAIAREIVAAHGGSIACRSGIGETTFDFTLPCTRAPLVIRPERIAIVDDNPFVLEAWEAKLGQRLATTALSPEGFWKEITARPTLFTELTLVITDQDFGTASAIDGLAFAAEIKARRPELPVLLSSDMPIGNQTTFIRGIDGVLPKEPVDAPQLVALFN